MNDLQNLLHGKLILIYGFGKSGYSSYEFLKKNNTCKIIDDNQQKITSNFKKKFINYKTLNKFYFDFIVISPGIDIRNCKLSKYLKKNISKIISELDIFYLSYPKVKTIAITGTNGKSTTSKLLYEVLKANNIDARLTGNIGFPILLEKKIKNETVFIIEASSYQLDYSKFFKSNYSAILNVSPDHIERHGSFKKYVEAKFKIIKKQKKGDFAFVNNNNKFLNKILKKNKIKSKISFVNYKKFLNKAKMVKNDYFNNLSNLKNLSFVFAISKCFKVDTKIVIKVANKFKGLQYRQQVIYDSNMLKIINDSKSTSLSSTIPLLETYKNIYWLLGGQAKKNDALDLNKKYFSNVNAYIFGKNTSFFKKILSHKIKYKTLHNISKLLEIIFKDIKKGKDYKKILLFSPAAASFDQFKNFEERGKYFNKIIKKYIKNFK